MFWLLLFIYLRKQKFHPLLKLHSFFIINIHSIIKFQRKHPANLDFF